MSYPTWVNGSMQEQVAHSSLPHHNTTKCCRKWKLGDWNILEMIWEKFSLLPGYLWTVLLCLFCIPVYSGIICFCWVYSTIWDFTKCNALIVTKWAHLQEKNNTSFPAMNVISSKKTKIPRADLIFTENVELLFIGLQLIITFTIN